MKLIYAVLYGDMLMLLYNQCKPYEIEKILRTSFWQGGSTGLKAVCYPEQIYAHKEHLQRYAQRLCGASQDKRRRSLRLVSHNKVNEQAGRKPLVRNSTAAYLESIFKDRSVVAIK